MTQAPSLRVAVLFGGRSGEHAVSLNSARNVMHALEQAGHHVIPMGITPEGRWLVAGDPLARLANGCRQTPALNGASSHTPADSWELLPHATARGNLPAIDVIFPVLHGTYGEDGTIQGLLEMANLPYVGCGVLASAVAMDKAVAKQLFAHAGLRQTPYRAITRAQWRRGREAVTADLEHALPYPLFVKPANLGSSVGIGCAADRRSLQTALDNACRYDRKVVIEKAVPNAREIEVSILGNDEAIASLPGEIVPGDGFYDYAAKYLNDSSTLLIPAPLEEAQITQIQAMALEAFEIVDGDGLARVDFLLDSRSGEIYLNEINTMPGFTRTSMYPKLWEASGITYPALVDRLLQLALARHHDRQQNCTTFEL